jgi:hypothetical protein
MVYLVMENNLTNQNIMNHSSSKHQAIKKMHKNQIKVILGLENHKNVLGIL